MKEKEYSKKGWVQYPYDVVNIWDDFINWEKRKKGEGSFFVDILKKYKVKKVLDIACGTGYDSIKLIKAGFQVKCSDGSKEMIKKAKENFQKENIELNAVQSDWKNLIDKFRDEKFDAIICLGNSFTHLFYEKDKKSVLNQIYFLLNKGGVLIIDQRNYDYILSKGYKSKHKYVYCGETINVDLLYKSNSLIKFKYTKKGNGFFILELYPIRVNEIRKLIKGAGFKKIEIFGDFEKNYDSDNTDFIQHIAVKD